MLISCDNFHIDLASLIFGDKTIKFRTSNSKFGLVNPDDHETNCLVLEKVNVAGCYVCILLNGSNIEFKNIMEKSWQGMTRSEKSTCPMASRSKNLFVYALFQLSLSPGQGVHGLSDIHLVMPCVALIDPCFGNAGGSYSHPNVRKKQCTV